MAFMQIVYGPLTDTRGRRNTLLPGIMLYIMATVGAALSGSIYGLLFFRILQAAGIAVGSVVAVTVIGDLYEGPARGRAMGTFQTLVALGPVLGPVLGGFAGQYFGISGVFWVLAISGTLLLLLNSFLLPETKPVHHGIKTFKLQDFYGVFVNRTRRCRGTAWLLPIFFHVHFSGVPAVVAAPLIQVNPSTERTDLSAAFCIRCYGQPCRRPLAGVF